MKLVNTDNFGGDYPNEYFLDLPDTLTIEDAETVAAIINKYVSGADAPRFIEIVANDYKLAPVFEP